MFRNHDKIQQVIETIPCPTHKRSRLEPCWWVKQDKTRKISFAVCDARARAAGFNGRISEGSLSRNYNKKQEKSA